MARGLSVVQEANSEYDDVAEVLIQAGNYTTFSKRTLSREHVEMTEVLTEIQSLPCSHDFPCNFPHELFQPLVENSTKGCSSLDCDSSFFLRFAIDFHQVNIILLIFSSLNVSCQLETVGYIYPCFPQTE